MNRLTTLILSVRRLCRRAMEPDQLVTEWMSAEALEPVMERGDIVEFRRVVRVAGSKRRIYTHWALYIGKLDLIPRLVHISTEDGDFEVPTDSLIKDSFGAMKKLASGGKAEVRCDPLFKIAGTDNIRINNNLDRTYRPFPPSIVVERATGKLGEGGYSVLFHNCEHFVKWCRYGQKTSQQAVWAKSVMLASVLVPATNPVFAVSAGLLFAAGAESVSRLANRTFGSNFNFF